MRSLRRRPLALLGLVAYGAGALALPLVHQVGHRDDHRHGENGAVFRLSASERDDDATPIHVDAAHRFFDDDLTALELSDAGHFGIAVVDCDLARYTLAACDSDERTAAHTFGDELLARAPHPHRHPSSDPAHGRGSLLHFGVCLVAPALFLLPPPLAPAARAPLLPVDLRAGFAPFSSLRARGPPASASA